MTELVSLKHEHQTAASLYGNAEHLTELLDAVRKVAPWANDQKQPMSDGEIALVVRRAVAMGLDPLNAHEVQIWKDNRGAVNFDISYILRIEWVRHVHGEHTEPQYRRLIGEELKAEGLLPQDVAYRVTFLMKKDLPGLTALIQAGYTPAEAREMLEVSGLGVALAAEYNGPYFAANGRSKSWKVQKRALTDAYRHKFGDPTRLEIEKLRRIGGFDNLRPEDWEGGVGLAPDDAQALAKSTAQWRAHNEALENDPEYRKAQTAQNADAGAALWGDAPQIVEAELVTMTAPEEPDFDEGSDAAMVAGLVEEALAEDAPAAVIDAGKLPADCPTNNWTDFLKYVIAAGIGYTANMHAVNTLKEELGNADSNWTPWSGARLNGDAAEFWRVLVEHAIAKEVRG